jgi:hypothetical protein
VVWWCSEWMVDDSEGAEEEEATAKVTHKKTKLSNTQRKKVSDKVTHSPYHVTCHRICNTPCL